MFHNPRTVTTEFCSFQQLRSGHDRVCMEGNSSSLWPVSWFREQHDIAAAGMRGSQRRSVPFRSNICSHHLFKPNHSRGLTVALSHWWHSRFHLDMIWYIYICAAVFVSCRLDAMPQTSLPSRILTLLHICL